MNMLLCPIKHSLELHCNLVEHAEEPHKNRIMQLYIYNNYMHTYKHVHNYVFKVHTVAAVFSVVVRKTGTLSSDMMTGACFTSTHSTAAPPICSLRTHCMSYVIGKTVEYSYIYTCSTLLPSLQFSPVYPESHSHVPNDKSQNSLVPHSVTHSV